MKALNMLCALLVAGASVPLASCRRAEGGPPGISIGAKAFRTTRVTPLNGWVQTGVYDSAQGREIAVLEYGKITFLDPKTYAVKRTIPVRDDHIGDKELVSLRADGQLNLLAGGGGYQDVGWFDLDGHRLWTFRVKGSGLPPNRLLAADLDGDGTKEFYVADSEGVFRLDAEGQIVWRDDGPKRNDSLLTLPADKGGPAVVVTDQGMWEAHGKPLQRGIRSPGGTYMLQAVRWEGGASYLASGETSSEGGHVFVFDRTGRPVFKQTVGDWGVNDILAVRFRAGEPPCLVVVGGRGGGTDRMELNVFAHDGTLLYREVCPTESLLVVPDDAAGTDTLLRGRKSIEKLEKL